MVDFLLIGPYNAITYTEVFPLFKDCDVGFGWNRVVEFEDGVKFGNIRWLSNISDYCPPRLVLSKKYVEDDYNKYDNYDSINIDRIEDIPYDYDGIMGVPISFMDKYNSEQFDVVGLFCDRRNGNHFINGDPRYIDEGHKSYVGPVIDGKAMFNRILIKKK